MKHSTFLITLLLGLFLFGCGQAGSKNSSSQSDTIVDSNGDKEQIGNLVKQVLKWHEKNGVLAGFEPIFIPNDSLVQGMDLTILKPELKKLTESKLFDKEFVDNYESIVLKIDKKIKSKEIQWLEGDMPPYAGADPWCNCQDIPYDDPWDKIEIKFQSIDKENATLTWTWGNSDWSKDFNYKVKAKKTDGVWKISYLQGFDINEFVR
jgi:hypothetical protein